MSGTTDGRRWSRLDRGALLVVLFVALASIPFLMAPCFHGETDASTYVLTSRAMLAGEGYSYLGEPFILRPPGLPVLILPVLALFGTNFVALNVFTNLIGVASAALLFAFLRPRLGALLSAALSLSYWFDPAVQEHCNSPMSDIAAIAFLLAALLFERAARDRPGTGRLIGLGLAAAAAIYTRKLMILVLPAVLLAWLVRPSRSALGRRLALGVALPCLLLLPWWIRGAVAAPSAPTDQTKIYSQSTGMWRVDKADPESPRLPLSDVLVRIPTNLDSVFRDLGSGLVRDEDEPGPAWPGIAAVAAVAFLGLRRRAPAELFCLGCIAVLAIWHSRLPRLVLPVYVIAYPAVALVLVDLLRRFAPERVALAVPLAAVLAVIAIDLGRRNDWSEDARMQAEREDMARVLNEAAPDSTLGSYKAWKDALYLERPVYTYRYGLKRDGARGALEVFAKYGVETVIVPHEIEDRPDRPALEDLKRLLRRKAELLHAFENHDVYRIDAARLLAGGRRERDG